MDKILSVPEKPTKLALVVGDEVQYDENGEVIYLYRPSIDDYLDNLKIWYDLRNAPKIKLQVDEDDYN